MGVIFEKVAESLLLVRLADLRPLDLVLEAVGERVEHALHPFTNERGTEVVRVEGLQVVNGLAHADAVDGQAQLA